MKRQILKSFAALCAGVMTLCASSFFASCDRIDNLEQAIAAVEKDVAALREDLTQQLNDLTARVDALYTLSFQVSDKNELQYSFDGGKTWVGTKVILVEEGDLKFKVSQNELMYSEDGGTSWKASGVILAENCDNVFDFKVENGQVYFSSGDGNWKPTGALICSNPKAELIDNGDSVTIKVGEASFTINKPEEIVFELKAGKLYFASEAVQKVGIKSSGIEDITVMSAPKGWYAEINSEGLVEITAPKVEDTDDSWNDDYTVMTPASAVAIGHVKVHACSVEGKCMVGKLAVEVSGDQLIVKAYGGKYEIATTYNYLYYPAYFGISLKENYQDDAKKLIDSFQNADYEFQDAWKYKTNDIATGLIADVLGSEPVVGKEYVVWAVQELSADYPTLNDLVLAFYSPVAVNVKEDEAKRTAYDNYISIEVLGAESYWALAIPDMGEDFGLGGPDYYKEQMVDGISYGYGMGKLLKENYEGSLYGITEGTNSYVGQGTPGTTGTLLILPVDGRPVDMYTVEDVLEFKFDTNPLMSGGAVNVTVEQVYEAKKMNEFWEYEVMPIDRRTELAVKVTMNSENWNSFYFAFFTEEQLLKDGAVMTDEQLVAAVLSNQASYPISKEELDPVILYQDLNPASTRYFVSFVVDEAGKFGNVTRNELVTDDIKRSEMTYKVEVSVPEPGEWDDFAMGIKNSKSIEFKVTTGQDALKYKYVWMQSYPEHEYEGIDPADLAGKIHVAEVTSWGDVKETDLLEGGKLVLDEHEYGNTYYFAILPYDMDGNPAAEAYSLEYSCNFELAEVISDPAEFAFEPVVYLNIPEKKQGSWGELYYWKNEYGDYAYSLSYTVEPVAGTEIRTLLIDPKYGFDALASAKSKASSLWAGMVGNQSYAPEILDEAATVSSSLYAGDAPIATVILVSWKDAAGKYYYKEVDITPALDFMYKDLNWDGTPAEGVNTPDGKQWVYEGGYMLTEGDYKLNMLLDFGVTVPGKVCVAYDATFIGAPEGTFLMANSMDSDFEAIDGTCGYLIISNTDVTGSVNKTRIPYYGLTETSCLFPYNSLLGEEANCTINTNENIAVMQM